MKLKKWLSLLLVVVMVAALFTACADAEKPADEGKEPSGPVEPDKKDDEKDDEPEDEEPEIAELIMWIPDWGNAGASGAKWDLVHEQINALLEEKINAHVDVQWINASDYATQFMLAMTNGDQIDLAMYQPQGANFSTLYAKNGEMDITELMPVYAPDALALLGDLINATKINGKIYGASAYRMLNSNSYFVMRSDVLNDIGMLDKAKNATCWADVEEIYQAYVDSGTPIACLGGGYGTGIGNSYNLGHDNWADIVPFDALGDQYVSIYTDKAGNVSKLLEQPAFINGCKRVKDWFDKGYVYPDTFTSTETPQTYLGSNAIVSALIGTEYGAESSILQQTGYDCVCTMIAANDITTSACQNFGLFVPVTALEPEAALKLLNLLYIDAELQNLFAWGVEGETYVIEDGVGVYPEGTDISNCGFHSYDFLMGNQFLILPWDTNGKDYRTLSLENFLQAAPSYYLGLAVDTSSIENLRVNIKSAYDEYYVQLTSGNYSDELYNEYLEKLNVAGYDDYVAFYQNAVNDFFA